MAEETQQKPTEQEPITEVAVTEQEEEEEAKKPTEKASDVAEAVTVSPSLKEESNNKVADLVHPEKKALGELKQLIQDALKNKEFTLKKVEVKSKTNEKVEKPETEETKEPEEPKIEENVMDVKKEEVAEDVVDKAVIIEEDDAKTIEPVEDTVISEEHEPEPEPEEEISIYGVPLTIGDEKSDTILLKFLRARDFKVKDTMAMIKNSVIWRKRFGIDSLVEEDLETSELEKAVFYSGFDREGHPVCYNAYGEFRDKEFYGKVFGDEAKREKFLRWRIQYLEKGIRDKLDFSSNGVCSMVQVTDLKNLPGPGKKELRATMNKALTLLQDNYPEFAAKQVFINVPWWYLAYNMVVSPFFTQRSRSKFVFAGSSKSAETLFKYIAPEQVPVQYGGLSKENDSDFTTSDAVTEVAIKPTSKHTIEIPATEGSILVWELRVLEWEVSYSAEFSPAAEDGYAVIVQKARNFASSAEPYVKDSFKIGEQGKVILTIDNFTSKKKKLLYRSKEKISSDSS